MNQAMKWLTGAGLACVAAAGAAGAYTLLGASIKFSVNPSVNGTTGVQTDTKGVFTGLAVVSANPSYASTLVPATEATGASQGDFLSDISIANSSDHAMTAESQ